jgi:hypothetical protein
MPIGTNIPLGFSQHFCSTTFISPHKQIPKSKDKPDLDTHVTLSISLPRSVKADMDRRCESLRMARTDYVKQMILWDLDKGEGALFDFPRTPRKVPKKGKQAPHESNSEQKQ